MAALAQTPPRDAARSSPHGTSSITGIVTSDESNPRPLRRARVTLTGTGAPAERIAITDDGGAFVFSDLPVGRYAVIAHKDGFVPMAHGATRTGRPGTGIMIADGESRSIAIRLPRGGVITGTITDAQGQPLVGAGVSVFQRRYSPSTGERRLTPIPRPASATDDRGVYRIFGLPAGQYIVLSTSRTGNLDFQTVSPADVRRALAEVRSATKDIGSRQVVGPAPAAPYESKGRVAMAPVYYPGTTNASQAAVITLGIGEERGGIDFQLETVPVATVHGTLPPSSPPPTVHLGRRDEPINDGFKVTAPDPLGKFSFAGLPPGQYTVTAITRAKTEPIQWAAADVTVDGQDVGVALTFQPTLTIAGRLAFEGNRPNPLVALGTGRVPLPLTRGHRASAITSLSVDMDVGGRFTIAGIVPGQYNLLGTDRLGTPIGTWWLKSIVMNGREILDAPLDLRHSSDDVIVAFSDRASEIAGRVTGPDGVPRSDRFVVIFSADKAHWFVNSRRVTGVRPDPNDGRYRIRNLPPGNYFIALADIDHGEWFDPEILDGLLRDATRVTLGEYEEKKQDRRQ